MGINRKDLELLIHLRQQEHIPLNPFVIELGAQQLSNSFLRSEDLVRKAEGLFGARSPYVMPHQRAASISPAHGELLSADAPFARDFWIALGFDYSAIDVDGSPGSIPLDLNYDSVPDESRNRYGLVTNMGTTEHVCNQLNCFKVVHDLTAVGGVMIHHLPAGGSPNHGLVNYNMKFFWHLARSNDYGWLYMTFRGGEPSYSVPENILKFVEIYEPTMLGSMREQKMADYAALIALQKKLPLPFVPPVDIGTGATTTDARLNRRYWPVFQPKLLESIRSGGKIPDWVMQSPCSADEAETAKREGGGLNHTTSAGDEKSRVMSGENAPSAPRDVAAAPRRLSDRQYIALVGLASSMLVTVLVAILLVLARVL